MVATYSPHGDAGGTLHFPSPTHIHHVDPSSAFRQLRRSLSRSPSKGPTFRLIMSKSTSPSSSSPLSPPFLSTPNRSLSENLLTKASIAPPTPLAIPYPLSARQNRSVARKLSPMRMGSRSGSCQRQRSPGKRTLSDSIDHGNATPRSSGGSSDDIENRVDRNASPPRENTSERNFKSDGTQTPELIFAPHRALARVEKGSGSFGSPSAKSSPLKRSDGIMNLDQASLGSPSAKRRSLHGGIFSADFNIFDHEAEFEGISDGSRMDTTPSEYSSIQSPLPRRTSSLRKTTLQQRHEKPSFVRSKPNIDLSSDFATPGQAVPKSRFRMSLDNFLPSMTRDSPFSSQGSLPNASAHPIPQHNTKPQGCGNQPQPPRHPLSRTLTQTSSNSSMAEDSPTHLPIRQPEHRRTNVDFSKSMPLGSARPVSHEAISNSTSSQASTERSFATPENYKLAKPLPAAFMSTGLISKRNRNMDDTQSDFRSSTDQMPDTPCKRHSVIETVTPVAGPEDAISKPRHVRHSFGTPSTPFTTHAIRPAPGTFGKGVSVFGSSFAHGSINRRGSFLGVDAEGQGPSMHGKAGSQSSVDFELPPTPTKQVLVTGSTQPIHGESDVLGQAVGSHACSGSPIHRPQSPQQDQSCKSILVGTSLGSVDGDSDSLVDDSPSAALRFRSLSSVSRSLTHSRLLRNSKSPAPLITFHTVPLLHTGKSETKRSPLLPVTPVNDLFDRMSPHTPREHVIPPDPSNLSISGIGDSHIARPMDDVISSPTASLFAPATPTAPRESFPPFGKSRSSINSSVHVAASDVDPSLTSRFDKVDLIGTGEFSSVYRVTKIQEDKNAGSCFALPKKRTSPRTPIPDRIWAVKKTRHAYIGPKDRQRKLQEVAILSALGQADHTVNLFDSWEDKNHLYIQTEFCEEGSLKLFLDEVGHTARLDDFRIWKIMLELSLVGSAYCCQDYCTSLTELAGSQACARFELHPPRSQACQCLDHV